MADDLTVKGIDAIQPTAKRQEIADGHTRGLYLVVQTSGAKSWAVRYRIDGRTAKDTLGRYPAIGLAKARNEAAERLRLVARGVDPREEQRAQQRALQEKRAKTFRAIGEDFIEKHAKRNNRSWKDTQSYFERFAYPRWGDWPISDIRRRHVADAVDELAERAPYAARLLLANVRKLFNWALEREIVESNPASGIKAPIRIARRERVLSDSEIAAVWHGCEASGYPFGTYVRLLILTACRRNELAKLRWADIHESQALIVIPGERYKTGIPHAVPLSELACEVLDSVPRIEGFKHVFTSRGDLPINGFGKPKGQIAKAACVNFTLHDLRRTVRTGLSRLRIPHEIAERVLGHVQGGVSAHYDHYAYLHEKREALEAWGCHVENLIRPADHNVVALRQSGAEV